MKWLCKIIRHKWSAYKLCNVEDGDNVLASVAHYRECSRCHRKQVITYYKNQYEVCQLLEQAREVSGLNGGIEKLIDDILNLPTIKPPLCPRCKGTKKCVEYVYNCNTNDGYHHIVDCELCK